MFNQLFEFVEANLERIQPEKKKSEKKNSKSVGLNALAGINRVKYRLTLREEIQSL